MALSVLCLEDAFVGSREKRVVPWPPLALLAGAPVLRMLYEFTRRHPNSVVFLDQWMSRKLDVLTDDRRAADVFRFITESDVYFDRYVFLDPPIEALIDRGWQRTWQRKSVMAIAGIESSIWTERCYITTTSISTRATNDDMPALRNMG